MSAPPIGYVAAVVGTLVLMMCVSNGIHSGSGRIAKAEASSEETANTMCHYWIRQRLPADSSIQWAPMGPRTVTVEADQQYRVTVLYQVLHQGGPRVTYCRVRSDGNGDWRLISMD